MEDGFFQFGFLLFHPVPGLGVFLLLVAIVVGVLAIGFLYLIWKFKSKIGLVVSSSYACLAAIAYLSLRSAPEKLFVQAFSSIFAIPWTSFSDGFHINQDPANLPMMVIVGSIINTALIFIGFGIGSSLLHRELPQDLI